MHIILGNFTLNCYSTVSNLNNNINVESGSTGILFLIRGNLALI